MHSCNRNKEVERSEISLESCDCLQLWMSDRGTEALVLQFSWVCEVVARLRGVVFTPFRGRWYHVIAVASWNLV
jgi:hypothetical protein